MICERCKNKCDLCGMPILQPWQTPFSPGLGDPNKYYVGDMPGQFSSGTSGNFPTAKLKDAVESGKCIDTGCDACYPPR